ncbi:hypothetical protein, partial [Burkholderia ubonensis]
MPVRIACRSVVGALAAPSVLAVTLALGGCVTQPVPHYQASVANQMTLEGVMNFAADKARCRDENPQALSERCKR